MKSVGLKLIERKSFLNYFEEYRQINDSLLRKMRVRDLKNVEKQVAVLYEVVIFKKSCI